MRIGIDAGGTFTDFVVLRDDGSLDVFKLRSDPVNPAAVILDGIRRAAAMAAQVEIVHGSTVATNALLERKGARTAFITSPGFRDLLAIGRQNRSELYSLRPSERVNLVPSELCFEWANDPASLATFLNEQAPESVAICLLRAYLDPSDENAIEVAGPYVCRSSEIAPEFREYERASTTVLNAYVGPLMDRYLSRLETECPHPISIMQSSGGLLSAREARRHAVRTILSGPAGGVVGARGMARRAGFEQAIAFDMGGTSTDVSLVEDPLRFATEAWVEGLPVRVPMLDIHTVGAGGGSLASVDAGGRLRVGPESAGSRPGPACYGVGDRATVTDAHVVLGRIVPERFLDGTMQIDAGRARRAVEEVAAPLAVSVEQSAAAIVRIANSNMERAIRVVSVEKGHDPRDFPLVAFGGSGGLHACEMAEELGIATVIFPAHAGVLSALGMLLGDRTRDYAAGALGRRDCTAAFVELTARALAESPFAHLSCYADIRYEGQSYELTVVWDAADPRGPFEEAYRRIYGFHDPDRPIEVVTARVRATEPADTGWFTSVREAAPSTGGTFSEREVFHKGAWVSCRVGSRSAVMEPIEGPALLFDYGSTIFIPPAWIAAPRDGQLVASRRQEYA